jgi:hypothetical protein
LKNQSCAGGTVVLNTDALIQVLDQDGFIHTATAKDVPSMKKQFKEGEVVWTILRHEYDKKFIALVMKESEGTLEEITAGLQLDDTER